jgi:ubiquinone/menaquinone biosynthesis C-methylase UbiE
MRFSLFILCAAAALAGVWHLVAQEQPKTAPEFKAAEKPAPPAYLLPPEEPPGLTEYLGRQIAVTMHWQGAPWLQRETREKEEGASLMRTQLGIEPGMTVCDLGSGDGYHTLWMADKVGPTGLVYAVDVQPEMLQMLEKRTKEKGITHVKPIHGKYWDPLLPPASQDLILLVDVYHEFSHPVHMLKAIRLALKPKGKLVLVEFRTEDPKVPIKQEHKMSKAQMALEIPPQGFRLAKEYDELPWQHMMFYEKTDG